MFHWTERTGYRVIQIQPFERAAVCALFASGILTCAPIALMLTRSYGPDGSGGGFLALGIAVVACACLLRYWWSRTSWIELPTRPGPVRWSTRQGDAGTTPASR